MPEKPGDTPSSEIRNLDIIDDTQQMRQNATNKNTSENSNKAKEKESGEEVLVCNL